MENQPARFFTPVGAECQVERFAVFRQAEPQVDRPEFGGHPFETGLFVRTDPRMGAKPQQVKVFTGDLVVYDRQLREVEGQRECEQITLYAFTVLARNVGVL